MVNLVTSTQNDEWMKEYSEKLIELVPSITTIINNINEKNHRLLMVILKMFILEMDSFLIKLVTINLE